jgi:hypothetical protein
LTSPAQAGAKPEVDVLSAAHFQPYQGGLFRFQPPDDGEPVEMELLEVSTPRKPAREVDRYRREPFSLLFRGAPGRTVAPVLHTLIHDAFEPCLIFVSRVVPPVDRDPKEAYYEAVFN